MDKVKFYCRTNGHYTAHYPEVKYEALVRDAAKEPTTANLNFIGKDTNNIFEVKNEFNSIRILDAREGSSFYFYIGIETGKGLAFLKIRGTEISDMFPTATMLDGELIGSFKFVKSGSHTRLQAIGDQNIGYCKYWLKTYSKFDVFNEDEIEGMGKLLEGAEEDTSMCRILIESRKGDYYKVKFGSGS